jgi:hypothetical protein
LTTAVSDEHEINGGLHAVEPRIESLAHDLAVAINRLDARERESLRDVAVAILRDEVQPVEPPVVDAAVGSARAGAGFNPFGIAIPLGLVGALLVFLFPPVGLLMFGAAAMMLAWGIVATLVTRR